MPRNHFIPERLSGPIGLVGITVLPMDSNRVLANQTVVIDDGRIKTVGPAPQVSVEDLQVIDARGKFLMPGLADMHVHYWDPGEAGMYLANGVTVVRNMWGDPIHRALEERNRSGESPGPRIITTSPLIDGLNEEGRTLWRGSNYVDDPKRAERFVRRYAEQGYAQIKVYSQLDHRLMAALGRAAAQNGVRLVGHCPNPMTFEEAIDAGMTCFEHLTNVFFGHFNQGVESPKSVRWDSEDYIKVLRAVVSETDFDSIRRLAALMATREVWNCPTITVWQGGIHDEQRLADPRLEFMSPQVVQWWTQRPANATQELDDLAKSAVQQRIKVLRILREEGAPVIVGTDTPNPFVIQGFSIHDEIDNFLAAGFTPYETLKSATVDASRFAGESAEWGTVSEGKRADLIITSRNPLEDAGVLRTPEAVLTNGYYLSRADLDLLLSDRKQEMKKTAKVEPLHIPHEHETCHLTEKQFGVPVAKICCNAIPRPEGGLIVEESRAELDGAVTSRKIFLGPDRKLERAEQTRKSRMGDESILVERTGFGYASSVTSVDGFEHRSEIEADALYPSDVFGVAAVSEMLPATEGSDVINTLSIDHDEVTSVEASIERKEGGEIAVVFLRRGTPAEQNYQLGADGKLSEVREVGWWPRETTLGDE